MPDGTDEPRSRSIGALWETVWRRRLTVGITVAVFVVGALIVDVIRTTEYTATSTILFVSQSYSGTTPLELTPEDIATQIRIVQSTPVRLLAEHKLGDASPTAGVAQNGTTATANITVTSSKADLAARAANAYALGYIEYTKARFQAQQTMVERAIQRQIDALQRQIDHIDAQILASPPAVAALLTGQLGTMAGQQEALRTQLIQVLADTAQSPSGGVLIQPATAPGSASSPKVLLDVLIAAVLGVLVGIGIALIQDLRDERRGTSPA